MTGFATAIDRDAVRVSGPDAATFLQGQLSQDVDALAVSTSTWTFVLQPDGKVHTWARLTKTAADVFLLDTDAGAGDALRTRLSRFLLRTKAEIEPMTLHGFAVRGEHLPHPGVAEGVLRLPSAHHLGYDVLGAGAVAPDGVDQVGAEALEAHRIEHGIPAMGAELHDGVIPAEVGQWIIDESVSFTKGCFVGQELVARIDSRGGNVPKLLRVITCDAAVEVGADVETTGPASAVTSVADSSVHGHLALAYCGRKVEPGTQVVVGDTQGIVHEFPLPAVGGG